MKNFSKRILSVLLVALMVISVMPMTKLEAEAANFVQRTTKPNTSNHYYYSSNPFYHSGYGLPNCTAYAWGRAYEILGTKPNLSLGNANTWYNYNKNNKIYKYGSTPKVGAIVCWSKNYGHVAVVEQVNANGSINMSESNWSGRTDSTKAFRYWTNIWPSSYYGGFQGYIYILDSDVQPEKDPYVNKNVTKAVGNYVSGKDGVNIRSDVGTLYTSKVGYVPSNTKICVTETKYNWGKTTYNGKTGWVCLDYFDLVSVPDATTPKITGITANNMAQGKNCVITWGGSSNAVKYEVSVNNGPVINCGTNTSYQTTLTEAKTYSFKVRAVNSVGKASSWSESVSCVSHAPCLVTIKDYNGNKIEKKYVDYGGNISIQAPSREGYTFQGWDGSTHGITKDITLSPIYKINTYNVKFWGNNDKQLGETQKVNYGEDATPPTDTGAPENYEFVNWSSEDYKNVFTDAKDKTINIYAIYKWANDDIPITCEITQAYRDKEGYHVMYNLKNNVSSTRNGRAIITLKTAEGKLVYTTESKAFSMPGNSEKNNIDEFFECDETASVIEIIIVNSYTSGIPISKSVTKKVTDGLGWSNWQDGKAPSGVEAEERTVYRYRDKQTTTSNTKTLSGWTWDGTRSESTSIGSWQDNTVSTYENESTRLYLYEQRTVQKYRAEKMYCYYHFYKSGGGNHTWCSLSTHANGTWHATHVPAGTMTYVGQSSCNTSKAKYSGPACSKCGRADIWFDSVNDSDDYIDYNYPDGTKQQYRYATTKYTYNFWRWMDWSDWSTTAVAETASRGVETKTQYRTYNGVEDTSGTVLTKKYYAGTDFAGKQATLFVYKFDAASDYTDEFVGQAVVGNDGYCTFNIKLREQPSIKTGDFTVALGIEGTTNTFVVDTFEAPKPTYTVNFYDWDGKIIDTQTVTEGESATLPSYIPEKEGYDFIGWSDTLTNVREDRDVFADMEKKEYQVIFVDWENQLIEVKTFTHGDTLVTPEFTQVEGYTFAGWDAINEGKVLVTSNMVVTAQYEANVYTVKFCDYDGNIVDVQEVEYGKTATPPEDVESADDKQFAGWYDPETYERVEQDVVVFPAYYYAETANIPTANYESGEFDESIKLTLTTDDENEVIFYYLNGDETTERIYTDPIDITKTTEITYYASCINKNDSLQITKYYCINTSNEFSGWMPYDNLPEDVRVNTQDYNLENADGYRYKNTVKTSSVADAAAYVADSWTYLSDEYSAYSSWQDAVISVDNSLIGFEVEAREAEDTTKQRYKLTRYKYTDANGLTAYSNTEVEGYDCTLEETFIELNDPSANPAGFFEGNTSIFYWEIDGEMWFNRKTVSGVKTQYRSRYKVNSYYKWSEWGITGPTPLETREYETDRVYRYSNKNYHIVYVGIEGYDAFTEVFIEEGKQLDYSIFLDKEGYNFEGLYYDIDCTELFDKTSAIYESVVVYTKYEPKEFTVIFQTDGGFELDVQKVKYMEAATEPSVFNMPGYVFSKWDKDFSCITEDTVVTGRYYKESDYARITLDRTVLDMFQGNDVKLNYTISPANLSGEAVEWSTSDPSIATVDDKGVVTALVPGEVTITAMVTKTRETATCKVIVNEDCGNYIVLTANSTLNNDSLGYLRRIGFNTTVDSALVNFRNDNLEFYNIDGARLTSTSVVGTGTTIVLKNGENILDKETVVITGDMTGDGLLNNRDVAMVNRYLVNKVTPQECQVVALDLNGDGYINNKDAAMAARYLVGKDAII